MITKRHLTPLDTDILSKDMKAVATTTYPTGIIDVKPHFVYTAVVTVVNVDGGAAGDAKLTLDVIGKDDATVYTVDIWTAIPTNTAGTTKFVLTFGAGVSATVSASSGTLGADVELFKTAEKIKLTLEVTTANNGTTSAASLDLLCGS